MKNYLFILLLLIGMSAKGQTPKPSSGSIVHVEKFQSKYIAARNVDVWLPAGYNPAKKYDVVYMHDGQMLFDSTMSWNKEEWRVDETVTRLLQEKKIKDCIVVGIWNTANRMAEYFPQKALDYLSPDLKDTLLSTVLKGKPEADNYLLFITRELKPYIDHKFSTNAGRAHTFIMGSSMGGLISMYAICEYPNIFGGAACLSTHWTGTFKSNDAIPKAFQQYVASHLPSPKDHKLYFDHGSKTLDSLYRPYQLQIDSIFKKNGYNSKNYESLVFMGADHSEHSWAKRLDIPFVFLLGWKNK
jgi:predicted alpha/beta superfamily hydrolase